MSHVQVGQVSAKDFYNHPAPLVIATPLASTYRVTQTFGQYGRYYVAPCVEFPNGKYFATIEALRKDLRAR